MPDVAFYSSSMDDTKAGERCNLKFIVLLTDKSTVFA
jgi:hypothetical protein